MKLRHFGLAKTALHGLSPHHVLAWFPATLPAYGPLIPTILSSLQVLHDIVLLSAAVLFSCTDPSTWNAILPLTPPNSSPRALMIIPGVPFFRSLSWPHHLPSTSVMFDVPVGIQLKLMTEWTVISILHWDDSKENLWVGNRIFLWRAPLYLPCWQKQRNHLVPKLCTIECSGYIISWNIFKGGLASCLSQHKEFPVVCSRNIWFGKTELQSFPVKLPKS